MHRDLILFKVILFLIAQYVDFGSLHGQTTQFGQTNNWTYESKQPVDVTPQLKWQLECGEGRCQIVNDDSQVFVLSGRSKKVNEESSVETLVQCLAKETGALVWSKSFQSRLQKDQQTFSGAVPSPQSTPILCNERLVLLTFTGQLISLRVQDGEIVWQKDLVNDYQADPVQFGFSTSPVVDPDQQSQFVILAGGKNGGLLCIDSSTGREVWKSRCTSSSYATPVAAKFGGKRQWVIVTKDEILGINADDGSRFWEYKLPEPGLTNVPTPLIIDDRRMVISGQGVKGTRCVSISQKLNQWSTEEEWFNRNIQFFYSNWLRLNNRLILGCTSNFLAALSISDGQTVGRFRGFSDSNLVRLGKQILVVDGKGNLSVMRDQTAGSRGSFIVEKKFRVLDERCWTPISIDSNRVYLRGGNKLCCLEIEKRDDQDSMENILSKQKTYSLTEGKSGVQAPTDPVQIVFDAFENHGLEGALEIYTDLRSSKKLDVEARIAIADGALEQGLRDVAIKILKDAQQDYPDSDEIQTKLAEIIADNFCN